jgi:acyl-homoserine lactone acylase PvdQ
VDDLFFAQGFVQAQDRLFQLDLWRRSVQGRLAEVLGPNFAERDSKVRVRSVRAADTYVPLGPSTACVLVGEAEIEAAIQEFVR